MAMPRLSGLLPLEQVPRFLSSDGCHKHPLKVSCLARFNSATLPPPGTRRPQLGMGEADDSGSLSKDGRAGAGVGAALAPYPGKPGGSRVPI